MTGQLFLVWLALGGAIAWPGLAFLWGRRLARRGARLGWTPFALVWIAWACGVWGVLIEPRLLAVRHVEIASAAWRGPPLRIGVISDTHVTSPSVSAARMASIVERMNREHTDVVVLLGDYVGSHEPLSARGGAERAEIERGLTAFRGLRAPLGVFAVLGNHDVWFDEEDVLVGLARAGARVLVNDAARVERPSGAFWIAGMADLESRRAAPSPAAALKAVPAGADVLMLMHEPDSWTRVPTVVGLSLAGHSHCGQVDLPLLGRLAAPSPGARRWPCGVYRDGSRTIYVSGGVGASVLPIRFRAPPEVAVVTLRSSAPLQH